MTDVSSSPRSGALMTTPRLALTTACVLVGIAGFIALLVASARAT